MSMRRGRRGTVGIAGIALLTLAAAGCGGGSNSGSSKSATPAGPPRNGGQLKVGEYSAITSLDPTKAAGGLAAGGNELAALYGVLMRYDKKSNTYVPELAQSLTPNADYTVWTLKLRPNVVFSDGTPFNAQAVIQNLQRDKKTITNTSAADLSLVTGMSAPDALTVSITLKASWSGFPYALSNKSGDIVAPSSLAKLDTGDTQATPIGAGPFKVSSFRAGEELTLVRNPRYALGAPHLDSIKFVPIAGGPATYQSFETGQLDVAFLNDAITQKQVAKDVPKNTTPILLGGLLMLNNIPKGAGGSGSVFSDVRLRKAVDQGIDPSVLNQRLYQNAGDPSRLLFPQGSRWYYQGEKTIDYNPGAAKALVSKVKSETGWDGTVNLVCNNSPSVAAFPAAVQSMLNPLGFKVKVSNSMDTTGEITQVLVKQDFDMACFAYNVSDVEPYPAMHQALASDSYGNRIGYKSPQMDAALNAFRAASSQQDKHTAITKIVDAWNVTVPSVDYNLNTQAMTINKPDVAGLEYTVNGFILFDKAWLAR